MGEYSIVIPAYNEADTIGATLRAVRSFAPQAECLVIDDGSEDDTAEIAANWADRVISLSRNQGKGKALQTGWMQAKGRTLLFLDADLQESAGLAWQLLEPVQRGECDMSIAVLPQPPGAGGWGLAKGFARNGIRWMTGREMTAPLSGQRAIRREVLETIGRLDHGFGIEVGLTVDALRAGFTVQEIPVAFTHRITGNDASGIWHRGKEFLAIGRALGCRWSRRVRASK